MGEAWLLTCLLRIEAEASPRDQQIDDTLAAMQPGATVSLGAVLCRGGPEWRFARAPARRG